MLLIINNFRLLILKRFSKNKQSLSVTESVRVLVYLFFLLVIVQLVAVQYYVLSNLKNKTKSTLRCFASTKKNIRPSSSQLILMAGDIKLANIVHMEAICLFNAHVSIPVGLAEYLIIMYRVKPQVISPRDILRMTQALYKNTLTSHIIGQLVTPPLFIGRLVWHTSREKSQPVLQCDAEPFNVFIYDSNVADYRKMLAIICFAQSVLYPQNYLPSLER